MLGIAISLVDHEDAIPVLVILEDMHEHLITSFFCFLVPVTDKDKNPELDLSRYTEDYVKKNILL